MSWSNHVLQAIYSILIPILTSLAAPTVPENFFRTVNALYSWGERGQDDANSRNNELDQASLASSAAVSSSSYFGVQSPPSSSSSCVQQGGTGR